jgi:hypothetical protein
MIGMLEVVLRPKYISTLSGEVLRKTDTELQERFLKGGGWVKGRQERVIEGVNLMEVYGSITRKPHTIQLHALIKKNSGKKRERKKNGHWGPTLGHFAVPQVILMPIQDSA